MNTIRGTMMRAVLVRQFGGIENMKVENNVPIPTIGDKQILIKIYASAINPVDTYIREGAFFITHELPYVPGMDGAGVVEALGKSVTKYKPGDRVFTCQHGQMGTLAEYTCVDESHVHPLDEKLSYFQGASIGIPYFTAHRALFTKAQAKKNERVLIHGASGSVGLAAVQMGKAYGLHIVGTAGTKEGMDLVSGVGADKVFNHHDPKYFDKLQKGEKFDVILEMLANVNLGKDLILMKPGGRTVVIGSRGEVTVDPRDIISTEAVVMGVALLSASSMESKESAEYVLDGINAGWVKPVVDRVYQLEEAGQAHHDIIHGTGTKGKLVVKVQEP